MKVIRFIFTVPFAILLLVLGISAGTLYSVRSACSEETVAQNLAEIQWSALELPSEDGTGTVTLTDYVNEALASYDIPAMSVEELDEIIRYSGADRMLLSLVQDFRGWFFDGNPKPVIDVKALADVIVKAACGHLLGTEKNVIYLPKETAEITFLSSKQTSDTDTVDYGERLAGLLPENADLADLMELLPKDAALSDLAEMIPEDVTLSDLTELLPEGVELSELLPEDVSLPEDATLSDLVELIPEDATLADLAELLPEDVTLPETAETIPSETASAALPTPFPEDTDLSAFTGFLEEMLIQELAKQIENDPSVTEGLRELDRALDEVEPYRIVVSSLALYLLYGIIAIVVLIILAINRKGTTLGLPHIGLAAAFDGFVFFALSKTLDYLPSDVFSEIPIPERTLRVFASPLFNSFGETGIFCLAVGAILFVFGIALGSLRKKKRDIR